MSSPFVAEIRMFGFNFAPTGWAQCNGQLIPISQNTALFSLIGTYYGGDGKSTFALPDLEGKSPMFWGKGSSTSEYSLGQSAGSETITLLTSEMPFHTHSLMGANETGEQKTLASNVALVNAAGGNIYQTNTTQNLTQMNPQAISIAGGGQPHNNMQPLLTVNFCIAIQGVFPARQ